MNELGPDARALLRAGRGGDHMSLADKQRIRSKLARTVGAGIAATSAVTSGTGALAASGKGAVVTSAAVKLGGTILLAGALGTITGLGISPSSPPQAPPVASVSSGPKPQSAAFATDPSNLKIAGSVEMPSNPPSTEVVPGTASNDSARRAVSPRAAATCEAPLPSPSSGSLAAKNSPAAAGTLDASADQLLHEVDALRQARRLMREGKADRALEALDDAGAPAHREGALEPEAMVTRVLALCDLGRVDDARSESDRFLARFPNSPLTSKVRASCAYGGPPRR